VQKRLDLLVRVGKQSMHTRRTEFVCGTIMAAHRIVITCSKWITLTIMLCAQFSCAHSYIVLILLLYLVPEEENFVWCSPAWDCACYLTCFCTDQSYSVESAH